MKEQIAQAKDVQQKATNEKNRVNNDLKEMKKKYEALLKEFEVQKKESARDIDM